MDVNNIPLGGGRTVRGGSSGSRAVGGAGGRSSDIWQDLAQQQGHGSAGGSRGPERGYDGKSAGYGYDRGGGSDRDYGSARGSGGQGRDETSKPRPIGAAPIGAPIKSGSRAGSASAQYARDREDERRRSAEKGRPIIGSRVSKEDEQRRRGSGREDDENQRHIDELMREVGLEPDPPAPASRSASSGSRSTTWQRSGGTGGAGPGGSPRQPGHPPPGNPSKAAVPQFGLGASPRQPGHPPPGGPCKGGAGGGKGGAGGGKGGPQNNRKTWQQEEEERKTKQQQLEEQERLARLAKQADAMTERRLKREQESKQKSANDAKALLDAAKEAMQVALAVRKLFPRIHAATPETFDAIKTELTRTLEVNRQKLGSQYDTVKREAERALAVGQARKDEAAAKKKEADKKEVAKEVERKVAELGPLLLELSDLIDVAEAHADMLKDVATSEDAKALSTSDEHGENAHKGLRDCHEFVKKHKLLDQADPSRIRVRPQMLKLQQRIALATASTSTLVVQVKGSKERAAKRENAQRAVQEESELFKKYQRPVGFWSREAITAYSKTEFQVVLDKEALDRIFKHPLVQDEDGEPVKKGFELEDCFVARNLVGIERYRVKDAKARAERTDREQKAAAEKAAQNKAVQDAKDVLDEKLAPFKTGEDKFDTYEASAEVMENKLRQVVAMVGTSDDLTKALDEIAAISESIDKKIASANEKLKAVIKETTMDAVLQTWWGLEVKKLGLRLERLKARCVKATVSLGITRTSHEARRGLECEKFRPQVVAALRKYLTENELTCDDLFMRVRGADEGGVTEAEFVSFVEEHCKCELSSEDVAKFYQHCRLRSGGLLDSDNVSHMVVAYHKVAESTVITETLSIKDGSLVRRLRVGELVEVLEGPAQEPSANLERVRCSALKDGAIGWVTVAGNQGTTFLEEGGGLCRVGVNDTILEDGGARKPEPQPKCLRKLKKGEMVDILESEKGKPDGDASTRVRVRIKLDGTIGWLAASKLMAS